MSRKISFISGPLAAVCVLAWDGLARAADEPVPGLPGMDYTSALLEMFFSLALVLAVLLGLYWLVRRFLPSGGSFGGSSMRMLGRLSLGPRKFLALVEVGGEVLVLGVSNESVNLLTKVSDPQALAEMRPPAQPSFTALFKKVRGGGEEKS